MSEFVEQLRALIGAGDVRVSEHGYDGLAEDGLTAREVIHGVLDAVLVEEYANYPGPMRTSVAEGRVRRPASCCVGYPEGT